MTENEALIVTMKARRKLSGMSIRMLSRHIGVSFSSLARMERGEGYPDSVSTAKIRCWLGDITHAELETIINASKRLGGIEDIKAQLNRIEAKMDRVLMEYFDNTKE